MAERQRRKFARENTQAPSRSLIADVTRRASLLWSGNTRTAPRPSRSDRNVLGNHTALASVDSVDVVPLDYVESSSPISPNTPNSNPVNSFYHPSDSSSPVNESQDQQAAVMNGSSNPPTPLAQEKVTSRPERPTLVASTSFLNPPPPKPLGLPPPCTPPPRSLSTPPDPIPSPSLTAPAQEQEGLKTRWWHDWLCGLTEGSDRGGDNQVSGLSRPAEIMSLANYVVVLGWQNESI